MSFYSALRPLLFRLDPELAHRAAVAIGSGVQRAPLGRRLLRTWSAQFEPLRVRAFGVTFQNPIGLAAGFDKGGRLHAVMADLGFGHMEIGSISARPWAGNPSPTLLRLPADGGLINRLGLNSEGAVVVWERLRDARFDLPVGINLVKTANPSIAGASAVADYLESFVRFCPRADFVTLNLSCPNTEEGRTFEDPVLLAPFLEGMVARQRELGPDGRKPVLIKLSPDLDDGVLDEILALALRYGVNGCVIGNTTTRRQNLRTPMRVLDDFGFGGLSGRPLKGYVQAMVRKVSERTPRSFAVVACGGVGCDPAKAPAEEVWEYLQLGATLVQVHTGLIYRGPTIAADINRGLMKLLEARGAARLQDVIDELQARRGLSPAPVEPVVETAIPSGAAAETAGRRS
jgi:dihydroorotate dehydrogenase